MSTKQWAAFIALFLATIAVIVGASMLFNYRPNTDTYITDRDTGEVYNAAINSVHTGGSNSSRSSLILFGLPEFIAKGPVSSYVKTDFISDIRSAITTFSHNNLHDTYPSITLRPQNMQFLENEIQAQLRLGQGDTIVPIDIRVIDKGSAALVIIDGGKSNGGKFTYVGGLATLDQTLYTITQTDYHGPDITVDSFTYRDAALHTLESLGYDIPDLKITFTHYQDPFQ